MVKVLVFAVLAACGTDDSSKDRTKHPDAAGPSWSCRMFVDCAGSASTVAQVVTADTQAAAETALVDECEAAPCSGALACHAVCDPL